MDQFGIDLDQVLNDFEEQENKKEIESLRDFGSNDEFQTDIFCEGKVLHQSKSQICESTSEAKISKHCLPSTNNILSSLNKYCKHFLRENVVNHVCCNDSRFHDKSPSEDNASDEIVEGLPFPLTNDLDSAMTVEVLDDDVECDETKNINEFDQEFPIESCICVENFKPVLLRNPRYNVSSMHENFEHLYLSQEHMLMNSEVAECAESQKSNEAVAVELPNIDLEVVPIKSLPKAISDKSFGTIFNNPIIVNAEDYPQVQSDVVIVKESFEKTPALSEFYNESTTSGEFPEGIAKSNLDEAKDHLEMEHETRDVYSSLVEASASEQLVVDINHDTCTFSETKIITKSEASDHEANSFTLVELVAKGNQLENNEEFATSQAKMIIKEETAGFETSALPVEKSMSEQFIKEPIAGRTIDEIKSGKTFGDHNDSSKEGECFRESSSSEEPCHAFQVQEEFDEDTFVKLSDADMRCNSLEVESQTHEQFIDVGAFNLSDMVAEDEYKNDSHKNGEINRKVDENEYENGDHDEDSIALKKLELEAAAFIEEMNVVISNDSQDLEDESAVKNVDGSHGDKSLAITDKLQILLHEKEKLLLDELNKHKNCLPHLEQELEQIPLDNDAISLEDLKSDGDDQETMDDLPKGDSFLEAKILTSKIVEAFASANDSLVQDGDDLCNGIDNVAEARVQDSIAHHSNNVIESDQQMDCTENGEASEGSSNNLEEQLSREGCIRRNLPEEACQNVPSDSIPELHRSSAISQPERKTHTHSSHPHSRPTHPGSLQFTQPQFFHAPSRCSNIDLPITDLGKVSPPWLPDSSTSKCLQCETSFSFLRRRHHCRACGLIFCNECCNVRYPLEYLNKKEERVCCKCFVDFNRASSYQNMLSSMSIPTRTSRPNPNNSSEYCSTIPPPLQAGTPSDPLPPVMVPTGVLRKQGMARHPSENKQVMFSDGIRPGGDLTHLDERPEGASSGGSKKKKSSKSSSSHRRQSPLSVASAPGSLNPVKSVFNQSSTSGWSEGSLPPLAVYSAQDFGYVLDRSKSPEEVFKLATDENNKTPVLFWLNANLTVLVKVIKKMCCAKRDLWCFTSQGMSTVGQDEVIILMEFNQSETVIPLDIFQAISAVYTSACSGTPIQNMGSIILPMSNSQEICGFLFINQTIQCVQNILLPDCPFLFGIFIKQVELTWARAFPLRLFFRLGAEFRYYPCPLFGVRDRAPVYGEIGHTIMNLLADFRNFQYSLSAVEDMAIHVEEKLTTIFLPRYKHHQVLKALSNSDDHVLALAGNFSFTADSHLVCSQNAEGSYQTQAMNIQGKIRSVTGASFVVFNGALKAASGYKAKMSIIEDGLMVQITPEDMAALKQSLGTADDFTIDCGLSSRTLPSSPGGEGAFEGVVALKWFSERVEKNSDIKSPIDKLNLSQLEHKRIHTSNVYATSEEGFVLIWTGLFFLNPSCASPTLRPEIERFSDLLASSCCKCLTPYIAFLFPPLLSKLTLRVKVSPDQIGYEAGINGSQLSNECLVALDNVVIPLLHGSSFASQPHDTSLELLFVVAKPIKA